MIKIENQSWISYNELAWVDPIIAPPESHVKETEQLCQLIRTHSLIIPQTLLHLGSGAGMNDYTFKKSFRVTGVDISSGMLEIARQINPETEYHQGDMRTLNLGVKFDAVACTEAIGYMATLEDTSLALAAAYRHLNRGGVFLFNTLVKETFQANNFVYNGSKPGIDITLFENNYLFKQDSNFYEATLIYLIRQQGELTIHTDHHQLGLFNLDTWFELLKEFDFEIKTSRIPGIYDPYLLGEGSYVIQNFTCIKA